MTHVVTESCINCRYSDCVAVCPVECFHVGPNFLVIDPEVCIDCGLCIPECPAEAIFLDSELPEGQEAFVALNQELAAQWPVISETIPSLDDADHWATIAEKRQFLVI